MTHSHGDAQPIEDDVTRIEEPLRSEFKAVFALGMLERWKGAPAEDEDLIPADIAQLVENAAERAVELLPPIITPHFTENPTACFHAVYNSGADMADKVDEHMMRMQLRHVCMSLLQSATASRSGSSAPSQQAKPSDGLCVFQSAA